MTYYPNSVILNVVYDPDKKAIRVFFDEASLEVTQETPENLKVAVYRYDPETSSWVPFEGVSGGGGSVNRDLINWISSFNFTVQRWLKTKVMNEVATRLTFDSRPEKYIQRELEWNWQNAIIQSQVLNSITW